MDGLEKQIARRKRHLLEVHHNNFDGDFLMSAVTEGLMTRKQGLALKENFAISSPGDHVTSLLETIGASPGASLDKLSYLLERGGLEMVADELLAERDATLGQLVIEDRIVKETSNIVEKLTESSLLEGNPAVKHVVYPSGRDVYQVERMYINDYVQKLTKALSSRIQVAMETMKRHLHRKQTTLNEIQKSHRKDLLAVNILIKDYLSEINYAFEETDIDFDDESNLTASSVNEIELSKSDEESDDSAADDERKTLTMVKTGIQTMIEKMNQVLAERDGYIAERSRCFMLLRMKPTSSLDESVSQFLNTKASEIYKTKSELSGKEEMARQLNRDFKDFKIEMDKQLMIKQKKIDYLVGKYRESQRNIINYQSALRNAREAEGIAKESMDQLEKRLNFIEKNINSDRTLTAPRIRTFSQMSTRSSTDIEESHSSHRSSKDVGDSWARKANSAKGISFSKNSMHRSPSPIRRPKTTVPDSKAKFGRMSSSPVTMPFGRRISYN